jgi:hypothetical protein
MNKILRGISQEWDLFLKNLNNTTITKKKAIVDANIENTSKSQNPQFL